MLYYEHVFDFERLEVYQRALNYSKEVYKLTLQYRKELQYSLGDQFRRAALSICNNIAEGSRKFGKAKKQFYEYAFDSARERIPMISISSELSQLPKDKEIFLRSECVQICNMLFKLSGSVKV